MTNINQIILLEMYHEEEDEQRPFKLNKLLPWVLTLGGLSGGGYLASQTNGGKSLINMGKTGYSAYRFSKTSNPLEKIEHGVKVGRNSWNSFKYGNQSPFIKKYVFPMISKQIKAQIDKNK